MRTLPVIMAAAATIGVLAAAGPAKADWDHGRWHHHWEHWHHPHWGWRPGWVPPPVVYAPPPPVYYAPPPPVVYAPPPPAYYPAPGVSFGVTLPIR